MEAKGLFPDVETYLNVHEGLKIDEVYNELCEKIKKHYNGIQKIKSLEVSKNLYEKLKTYVSQIVPNINLNVPIQQLNGIAVVVNEDLKGYEYKVIK